jgi:ABC-2 type transport system ATP-binding protein
LLFSKYFGIPRRIFNSKVGEILDRLGLENNRQQKAGDLSIGYRRRLQLAKCLMVRKKYLFLDEPTVGLDFHMTRKFKDIIREESAAGRTIVMSTHDLREAESVADKIVVLNAGKLVENVSLEDIKKRFENDTVRIQLSEKHRSTANGVRIDGVLYDQETNSVVARIRDIPRLTKYFDFETDVKQISQSQADLESIFLALTK